MNTDELRGARAAALLYVNDCALLHYDAPQDNTLTRIERVERQHDVDDLKLVSTRAGARDNEGRDAFQIGPRVRLEL